MARGQASPPTRSVKLNACRQHKRERFAESFQFLGYTI
jgi:hypothetical protein